MACSRIVGAAIGGRRKMQHDIGQSGETFQSVGLIEVSEYRTGALRSPEVGLTGIPQQGEEAVAAAQIGHGAAGNIAATDDQNILTVLGPGFHPGILTDGLTGSFDGFSDHVGTGWKNV